MSPDPSTPLYVVASYALRNLDQLPEHDKLELLTALECCLPAPHHAHIKAMSVCVRSYAANEAQLKLHLDTTLNPEVGE